MSGSRGGWPVLLADLALILFVATAVQASHSAAKAEKAEPAAPGIPQAYYSAAPGAPTFAEWIAAQGQGGQAQVTILSSYRPGEANAALKRAQALSREAQAAGKAPRILVEPGDGSASAILSYDDARP